MENRDMPAMPYSGDIDNCSLTIEEAWGLTKREHFAGLAMAAMVSNSNLNCGEGMSAEAICEFSVKFSDDLLAELERDNEL